jgi:flagellar biosynthesis GTPase FlhF
MNLKEALEEIREQYGNDAVVITSERDRDLGDFIAETDDRQEVWLEWGEVNSGDVIVPATHIFFLDEDGFMRHDGSVLSVVSTRDYERLGR